MTSVTNCFEEKQRNEFSSTQEWKICLSYYELYKPEFRKKLVDIMKKMCGLGDRDITDEPTEKLLTIFIEKAKGQAPGVPLGFCFKDIFSAMTHDHNQVHTRAQHGEENALEACDRSKCIGGTLYTTSSSCELCAKKALSVSCIIKIPIIAEGSPQSCRGNFPIIAESCLVFS